MNSCVCSGHAQALVHKRQAEYQVQLQKHAKLQKQHEMQQEQLVSDHACSFQDVMFRQPLSEQQQH